MNFGKNLIKSLVLLIILVATNNCRIKQSGGTKAVKIDNYVTTTEKRNFKLIEDLSGTIVSYQKAYECKDGHIYNSTAIIKLSNNDTITVYSPCLTINFNSGDKVDIKPISNESNKDWFKREIYVPFPKEHSDYGYWECISCKYRNTVGIISLAKDFN